MTQNMRLSELIRLGAMLRPQAFGDYMVGGGTCAIGAAAEACGLQPAGESMMAEFERGLDAKMPVVLCPAHCGSAMKRHITAAIGHLNDCHVWSRERIADWVEQIEREQQCQLVETPQADAAVVAPVPLTTV